MQILDQLRIEVLEWQQKQNAQAPQEYSLETKDQQLILPKMQQSIRNGNNFMEKRKRRSQVYRCFDSSLLVAVWSGLWTV